MGADGLAHPVHDPDTTRHAPPSPTPTELESPGAGAGAGAGAGEGTAKGKGKAEKPPTKAERAPP